MIYGVKIIEKTRSSECVCVCMCERERASALFSSDKCSAKYQISKSKTLIFITAPYFSDIFYHFPSTCTRISLPIFLTSYTRAFMSSISTIQYGLVILVN